MEGQDTASAEGGAIIRVLAAVLERLIHTNAHLTQTQVTKFHALKPPQITILAYLERIFKYASCSSECFILALIYIDRLISKNNFVLTELNGECEDVNAYMGIDFVVPFFSCNRFSI